MATFLQRVFKILPSELGLVAAFGGIIFFNSVSLIISEVVSVAGFIQQVGAAQLLLVWIGSMVLLALSAGSQSVLIDRFDRLVILRVASIAILGLYLLIRLLFFIGAPAVVNFSLLFLLGEQQALLFPLIFWVYANDIFTTPQAKRLFPVIASFPILGDLVGLGLMTIIPAWFEAIGLSSIDLLYLNAGLLLVSYLILTIGLRSYHSHVMAVHDSEQISTLSEGWHFVRDVPAFRYLALSMASVFIVTVIFRFHFLTRLDIFSLSADVNFERFYSLFWLAETILALIFGALIISRLIEKVKLKSISLIIPVIMSILISAAFLFPSPIVSMLAFGILYMFIETLGQTSGKTLQSLVPEKRLGRVSIFLDSYVQASGRIVGALIVGATLVGLPLIALAVEAHMLYLGIGIVIALGGVWAAWMMRRTYDDSLLNWRLKRRRHDSVRGTLIRKLDKPSPDE